MKKPAFTVQQLSVNYEKNPVLWDLSFEIPQGKLVSIVGPNGAGKSTLLKTSLGLVKPISGQVTFFGQSLKKSGQRVAYVPQRESVDWDFPITVFDLVLMGRYGGLGLFKHPSKKDRAAVQRYLEKVGLDALAHRQISQLSGGQQQRAFLARALIQEADLYLMDEPFIGIDVASTQTMIEILQGLRDEGKTLLVVHHDLTTVGQIFDWVVLLNICLVGCGSVESVFTPEMIQKTYGKETLLLDEATKLSQHKSKGFVTS
ncbi:MAG: Manganese transport system ATP-binding protein MntB [Chlamydiales bacterium]|nr:Manganese transport system ATP-binding protein MntB [Chlamydiales bacterium]